MIKGVPMPVCRKEGRGSAAGWPGMLVHTVQLRCHQHPRLCNRVQRRRAAPRQQDPIWMQQTALVPAGLQQQGNDQVLKEWSAPARGAWSGASLAIGGGGAFIIAGGGETGGMPA